MHQAFADHEWVTDAAKEYYLTDGVHFASGSGKDFFDLLMANLPSALQETAIPPNEGGLPDSPGGYLVDAVRATLKTIFNRSFSRVRSVSTASPPSLADPKAVANCHDGPRHWQELVPRSWPRSTRRDCLRQTWE
jgi:hypothetical protein